MTFDLLKKKNNFYSKLKTISDVRKRRLNIGKQKCQRCRTKCIKLFKFARGAPCMAINTISADVIGNAIPAINNNS